MVFILLGLTVVTGLIDAVSFLGLGSVFTANMTGNVVFLGFALGGAGGLSVPRSLAALVAFTGGSVAGGRLISGRAAGSRLLSLALYAEIVCLGLAAVITAISVPDHSTTIVYAVIVLTAVAMGLRNAVVRRLAVPDLTTTVLTLTVTGLASESILAGGTNPRMARRVMSIVCMLAGALAGAVSLRFFGMAVTLAVAAVLVIGLAFYLRHSVETPTGDRSIPSSNGPADVRQM